MPIINPSILFNQYIKQATQSQKFAALSPQAQAALRQVASYPPGSTLRQANIAHDPQLQAALQEAQQAGLLDNTPLWQAVLKGTGIALAGALAGPAIGGLVGGVGGAADPIAASMVPGAEGGLAAGAAGAGSAAAGGVGAAAASTGFGAALKSALPAIIGAGASVGGAAIAAHGNTEAAKIAAAQADKTLAQAKLIYEQQRADESPYRSLGASALGPLSFGLGLPAPASTPGPFDPNSPNPAPSSVVAAGAKDASGNPLPGAGQGQVIPPPPTPAQTGSLNSLGQSATVRMLNPATGQIHLIPSEQVSAALAAGGVQA